MSRGLRVAVVGATGVVGTTMRKLLHAREFPAREIVAFATERSAGRELEDIIDRIADSIAEASPPAQGDPQAGAAAAQMLASQAKMALAEVAQRKESREAFTDAQRLQLEQQKAQLDAWSAQNDPRREFIDIGGKA